MAFPSHEEILNSKWYAVVDDLIGGYAIATVNKPVSAVDYVKNEGVIADFINKESAEHIAKLHNRWLHQHNETRFDALKED